MKRFSLPVIGRVLLCLALLLGLSSCSSVSIDDYLDSEPRLDLRQFFEGNLYAAGVVEDFSGKVTRKFTVEMTAQWQGDKCELKEWFTFDDGEKQLRIWHITDLGQGKYSGRANDILGVALGQAKGSALRWRYDMALAVDDKTYQVHFDDWMYLVDANTLINKSDIIKFGVTVGKVTLVIQKKD
ncbi:DUF3833 domain-containing protein [Shewanella intestini]|uniref:DUF3833 family protein n=1 Tax=Shewanella intestini TaxID=2017544 RepID=A0ABS5HXU3_9GAMM|nr:MULTISPECIES: DUF3833 domain-containing protein [Shewanella]MBR9726587.1 DUF3833 family protein [Shewanella intestini]MRG34847.1 DUF3833 family protein [Shewanella sp. XMDDZSB0408]